MRHIVVKLNLGVVVSESIKTGCQTNWECLIPLSIIGELSQAKLTAAGFL